MGEFIGEFDILYDRPYKCSCKCIRTADVFCMKAEEFVRRLKPNKETWRIIVHQAKIKNDTLNARMLKILDQLDGMDSFAYKMA